MMTPSNVTRIWGDVYLMNGLWDDGAVSVVRQADATWTTGGTILWSYGLPVWLVNVFNRLFPVRGNR
jgi:hypothetical protein